MAVLAVLLPPLMLGLVLALDRYEELLLPEQNPLRPAASATPTGPAFVPAASPAPSAPPLRPTDVLPSSPGTADAGLSRAAA
ncbi:hypothetical protein ACFWOB_35495 [Streptomyces sp. NPDC058420]|uniref:hypothetical protein n=1 Tax=Streptomyces sp. NPDC058420 TaxID=3346489 RepID=UPI0036569A11